MLKQLFFKSPTNNTFIFIQAYQSSTETSFYRKTFIANDQTKKAKITATALLSTKIQEYSQKETRKPLKK